MYIDQGRRVALARLFDGTAGFNPKTNKLRSAPDEVRWFIYGRLLGGKSPVRSEYIPLQHWTHIYNSLGQFTEWAMGVDGLRLSDIESASMLWSAWVTESDYKPPRKEK